MIGLLAHRFSTGCVCAAAKCDTATSLEISPSFPARPDLVCDRRKRQYPVSHDADQRVYQALRKPIIIALRQYQDKGEGMMPINIARRLALNTDIRTEYLVAMFDHLNRKLRKSEHLRKPTPINTYRQRKILSLALKIRGGQLHTAAGFTSQPAPFPPSLGCISEPGHGLPR
jgi:hypothetical protein